MLCTDAHQFKVPNSSNWSFALTEVIHGKDVYKQGMLAFTAGASMDVEIRTRLSLIPADARVLLIVKFLTSYEHMGAVSVSCAAGCQCDSMVFQGHSLDHVSVEGFASGLVSQSEKCVLRFQVLQESLSGEHKAKVVSISVKEQ